MIKLWLNKAVILSTHGTVKVSLCSRKAKGWQYNGV